MKFNEILFFARGKDIIRSKRWKTDSTYEYIVISESEEGFVELTLIHKDGYWELILDTDYFEKIDDWEFLS